jgi:hypothetical protein
VRVTVLVEPEIGDRGFEEFGVVFEESNCDVASTTQDAAQHFLFVIMIEDGWWWCTANLTWMVAEEVGNLDREVVAAFDVGCPHLLDVVRAITRLPPPLP